jgi:hypothetical protein
MPILNRVSNENKLVEEKVNFFVDTFHHTTNNIGFLYEFELESYYSLTVKIIEKLKSDDSLRLDYLDIYLGNSLWNSIDTIKSIAAIEKVKTDILNYRKLPNTKDGKKQKLKILDSAKFQRDLHSLKSELEYKFSKILVSNLLSLFECNHSLKEEKHDEMILSNTLLLVSHYLSLGRTKDDIYNLPNKILRKDIHSFPFPNNIRTNKQREKYLANINLKEQLDAFYTTLIQPPLKNTLLIKVYGGNFPENFAYKYNKVEFLNPNSSKLDKIKEQGKQHSTDIFFQDSDFIVACVEVNGYSLESMHDKALQNVKQELEFISMILNKELSVESSHNFILTDRRLRYRGSGMSTNSSKTIIAENDLEYLKYNPYYILRKVRGEAKNWLLSFENNWVPANRSDNIVGMWLYLEGLLSLNRYNGKPKVQEIVSSILLTNEEFTRKRLNINTLINSLNVINGGLNFFDGNIEIFRKVHRNLKKGIIVKELRVINYPFIRKLVQEIESPIKVDQLKEAKLYYNRILVETRDFRNSSLHSGLVSSQTNIKLQLALPNMIRRFRKAIFDTLLSRSDISFNFLIDDLVDQGNALLTK